MQAIAAGDRRLYARLRNRRAANACCRPSSSASATNLFFFRAPAAPWPAPDAGGRTSCRRCRPCRRRAWPRRRRRSAFALSICSPLGVNTVVDHRHLRRMNREPAGETVAPRVLGVAPQHLVVAEIRHRSSRSPARLRRRGAEQAHRRARGDRDRSARHRASRLASAPISDERSSGPQVMPISRALESRNVPAWNSAGADSTRLRQNLDVSFAAIRRSPRARSAWRRVDDAGAAFRLGKQRRRRACPARRRRDRRRSCRCRGR